MTTSAISASSSTRHFLSSLFRDISGRFSRGLVGSSVCACRTCPRYSCPASALWVSAVVAWASHCRLGSARLPEVVIEKHQSTQPMALATAMSCAQLPSSKVFQAPPANPGQNSLGTGPRNFWAHEFSCFDAPAKCLGDSPDATCCSVSRPLLARRNKSCLRSAV